MTYIGEKYWNTKHKIEDLYSLWKDYKTCKKSNQLSALQKSYKKSLSSFRLNGSKNDGIIITQLLRDYDMTIRIAAAVKAIGDKKNLTVKLIDPHIYGSLGWKNKGQTLFEKYNATITEKIYSAFSSGVIFSNDDKYFDQIFIQNELAQIKKHLHNREDLIALQFEDIHVGDLIYDTYLRYYSKTTITEVNSDILYVIEIALNIYHNFRSFLSKNNIKYYIGSQTTYISHGIPVRMCLQNNIDTYLVGTYQFLLLKLSKSHYLQVLDSSKITPTKVILDKDLTHAENLLRSRLSGKIDRGTSYMTKSSYQLQDKDQALEDGFVENKRNVVIFTHDLFDSPHTDKSLLFGDYYLFLKESLDALATISNTTTWIKIHPFSEETGCIEEVIALVKSYSTNQFKILSHTISNAQIVQLKPDLAVTARGTVALEMAFYEIPCLTSYDNPYVNFDFVYTARSKEDFFTVIKGEKLISLDYNKRMIASCYYQMYLEHWPIKENGPLTNLESIMHHAHTNEYLQALNDHNFDSWKLELSKMYGVYVQSIKQ